MFAVNGPSGPTSRNERRVKSEKQREVEAETRRRYAEKKREQFFLKKCEQARSGKHDKEKVKEFPVQSNIFKGCRIVFNGRTGKVSSYYLAKLVQEHGGNVASAMTATRVTHMVGSNLSGSKADKVLKRSGKVKFVSPEWILQSVKRKKRLPEFEFLVYKDSSADSLRVAFSQAASSTT
ncbi:DNA binding protein [Phytophthora megakarya]|uniref:DNA binding protein n=1 Tax=Phytophthora megakarya TaxID=4795 RepID=A0A225X4W2_9STRA|nr:DNA binding protein [Phytophthora megakarya]